MMKNTFILCLTIFLVSCERDFSVINPELIPSLKPTGHDFSWEIDTLSFPNSDYIYPRGIWGLDANDVWMVGRCDNYRAGIWHFDGKKWDPILDAGTGVSPNDIIGFNKENVWLVGNIRGVSDPKNAVKRWNGTTWHQVDVGISNEHCFSIWGSCAIDVYLGYDGGLIVHFNGYKFEKYYTGNNAQILDIYGFDWNDVYACGIELDEKQPHDSTHYYIYHNDGLGWSLSYYQLLTQYSLQLNIPLRLWGKYPYLLFGVNHHGVFVNSKRPDWNLIFDPEESIHRIHGTDYNNIFIAGYHGSSIYHYDGDNWTNFENFQTLEFDSYSVFTITEHVFIGGKISYDKNGYILRGKRK